MNAAVAGVFAALVAMKLIVKMRGVVSSAIQPGKYISMAQYTDYRDLQINFQTTFHAPWIDFHASAHDLKIKFRAIF